MRTIRLTSPYTRGDHVKALQRVLKDNPWKKDFKPGRIDGIYGEGTAGAVKRAKYWLGYPSKLCTGSAVGDPFIALLTKKKVLPLAYRVRRRRRLATSAQAARRAKALSLAKSKLGVTEKPAGTNVVEFSRWYDLIGPWCAMFVTWCYVNAGSTVFKRGSKWSYVPYILNEAQRAGSGLTITASPAAGDLVLYDWGHDRVADHIGLFTRWTNKTKGDFQAVEGNTGIGNDSNGGEVMTRDRHKSSVIAFIRVHK